MFIVENPPVTSYRIRTFSAVLTSMLGSTARVKRNPLSHEKQGVKVNPCVKTGGHEILNKLQLHPQPFQLLVKFFCKTMLPHQGCSRPKNPKMR